jgi:hypothetical protein
MVMPSLGEQVIASALSEDTVLSCHAAASWATLARQVSRRNSG